MKQVMYGIEIADVNDFGGWVGYEPVREDCLLYTSPGGWMIRIWQWKH